MTLESVVAWLIFVEYVVTVVLGWFIAGLVRRHLSYWPCLATIAVTQGTKGLYFAIATFPLLPADLMAEMRTPAAEGLVQVIILAGLGWTVRLVMLQNRVEDRGEVTVDGRVEPTPLKLAQRRAKRSLELVGEAAGREGGDRFASYDASVLGGWAAVSAFLRERKARHP